MLLAKTLLLGSILSVGASSSTKCLEQDVESSPGGIKYIPSRCESLFVHGDTDHIEQFIAAIEMHSSLTSLSLARDFSQARHSGGLTIDDIAALFEVLPNTNIDTLDLSYNNVQDVGLEIIAEHIANTKLVSLNLEMTGITGLPLAKLLEKDESHLVTLNLANNNIGAASESLLKAAKTHSKLSSIGLEGTVLGRRQSEVGNAVSALLKGECALTKWSDWSACEGACGSEQQRSRNRELLHRPHARHGASCDFETVQYKQCKVRCKVEAASEKKKSEGTRAKSSWSNFFGSSEAKQEKKVKVEPRTEPVPEPVPEPHQEEPVPKPHQEEPVPKPHQEEPVPEPHQEEPVPEPHQEEPVPEPERTEPVPEPEPQQEEPVPEPEQEEPVPEPEPQQEEPVPEPEQEEPEPQHEEPATGPNYRTRLEIFYRQYNPSKIDSVDMMLDRFEGREEVLFASLVTKYGPEP